MLSGYCKKFADKYGIKVDDVIYWFQMWVIKLCAYCVLHYRNLQLHFSLGIKLTEIRRVLKFNQSEWMKKSIHFNTEEKTNAANSFEKVFFKIDDQFYLWQNNGKFTKKNQCQTSKE